jgi:hypothetical protein
MLSDRLRELFSQSKDRGDVEECLDALEYGHDDGHPDGRGHR